MKLPRQADAPHIKPRRTTPASLCRLLQPHDDHLQRSCPRHPWNHVWPPLVELGSEMRWKWRLMLQDVSTGDDIKIKAARTFLFGVTDVLDLLA